MGVLDPLRSYATEMNEVDEEYSDWIEWTVENLQSYAGAILNNRHDIMEKEDPFFFLIWRDEDVMSIDSMDEIYREIEDLTKFNQDLSMGKLESKYMELIADEFDVEPDYSNPIESYEDLEITEEKIENLSEKIENLLIEKHGVDSEIFTSELNMDEYILLTSLYTISDKIEAFPKKEAKHEALKNIAREKENLLSKAVDEHRKHKESVNQEYYRVKIPDEPVDWAEVIEVDKIGDYMDISDIPGITYGDTLHMMMEELADDVEGVEPEYPLHFRNKGNRKDTSDSTRIDNTLRPDALGDLFIYEFKHMPHEQRKFLEQHGELERNEKFRENIEQVNRYLNELDMPVGMLVQISSDMEIKEYVVERHESGAENYENFIHEREEYEFDNLASRIQI